VFDEIPERESLPDPNEYRGNNFQRTSTKIMGTRVYSSSSSGSRNRK
jgi:hypothetical protein